MIGRREVFDGIWDCNDETVVHIMPQAEISATCERIEIVFVPKIPETETGTSKNSRQSSMSTNAL